MPEPAQLTFGKFALDEVMNAEQVAEQIPQEEPVGDCFVQCPQCRGHGVIPLAESDDERDSQAARIARVRAQLADEHEARFGSLRVDRKPSAR